LAEKKTRISGNLTIRQLEVFAVASRYPTFSEAAKHLEISQPTLSNMIAKVEELLGLSLFDRTTRTLALTAEGERLAHVAQELVRDFQASLRSIHDTARLRHGRLSMAVLPSVAASIAPAAIKIFLKTYPDFDIALHDTARQEGLLWVLDRVVDFGILTGAPNLSELRSETIFVDHFQVVVPKGSPLAARTSLSWADVETQRLILTGTQQIRNDVEANAAKSGVSVAPRFEVQNIMTGLSLVAAGLGVTVLPKLYLPEIVGGNIKALQLDATDFSRNIELIHRSDRVLPEPVGHMMNCFREVFAKFETRVRNKDIS
jgi:LysR family transcriptional regulator, carnitine catabolism transcriptional activator